MQLANAFVAQGASVRLVLACARGPYLNEVNPRVHIANLQARGVLHSLPKLVALLRAERPDVLLSALDHANIIAVIASLLARSGTRCIVSTRSVPSAVYQKKSWMHRGVFRVLMSRIYPLADGVIANSTVAANDLIQNYRICADKLHVIHNPLDIELIRALADEPIDDRWFNQTSSPMVLAVGSLTVLKDFPTLLRAFSIVRSKRDCRLVILGQGPERELLDRIAAEQGLKADFYLPGFVQNPFAWMRGAAVLVSSSLTEGCPNALMQALACGTAVVSTDCVGGSSEILEGGRWGWLVPVMDAQAMAASIEAALDCKSPTNVRQRAEDFQIAHIARLYLRRMLPGVDWPAAEH